MQRRSLEQRVTTLEQQMREVWDLPKRMAGVESQILQLREETRDGFSAIRSELLAEIRAGNQESRNFMRAVYEDALARIATMGEKDPGSDR